MRDGGNVSWGKMKEERRRENEKCLIEEMSFGERRGGENDEGKERGKEMKYEKICQRLNSRNEWFNIFFLSLLYIFSVHIIHHHQHHHQNS